MVGKPGKSQRSHGDGGACSDLGGSHGLSVIWSVGLGAWITPSGDHMGLCDVKSWVRCVTREIVRFTPMTREIVRFTPTSVIDGEGA
jgi:hypothetical protein